MCPIIFAFQLLDLEKVGYSCSFLGYHKVTKELLTAGSGRTRAFLQQADVLQQFYSFIGVVFNPDGSANSIDDIGKQFIYIYI
jgi:hypothetical protein